MILTLNDRCQGCRKPIAYRQGKRVAIPPYVTCCGFIFHATPIDPAAPVCAETHVHDAHRDDPQGDPRDHPRGAAPAERVC